MSARMRHDSEGEKVSTLATPQETAFDPSVYDLPIPKVDGIRAKRLSVSFGGSLDRTNAEDLEVLAGLEMLQEVRLTVRAVVTGKGFSGKDTDGGPDVGYQVRLIISGFDVAA